MNFKSIIQGLYKGSDYKICYILNTGSHSECFDSESQKNLTAIHTGFYVQVQTGSVFEFIYHIDSQQLYFQRTRTIKRLPLGTPMYYTMTAFHYFECKENIDEWYGMYNLKNNRFTLFPIQRIKWIDKYIVESILMPDNRNITSFQVIGYVTNEDFPLHPKRELTLYKAKNFHVRESTYLEEGRRYHQNEERKNIET